MHEFLIRYIGAVTADNKLKWQAQIDRGLQAGESHALLLQQLGALVGLKDGQSLTALLDAVLGLKQRETMLQSVLITIMASDPPALSYKELTGSEIAEAIKSYTLTTERTGASMDDLKITVSIQPRKESDHHGIKQETSFERPIVGADGRPVSAGAFGLGGPNDPVTSERARLTQRREYEQYQRDRNAASRRTLENINLRGTTTGRLSDAAGVGSEPDRGVGADRAGDDAGQDQAAARGDADGAAGHGGGSAERPDPSGDGQDDR